MKANEAKSVLKTKNKENEGKRSKISTSYLHPQ